MGTEVVVVVGQDVPKTCPPGKLLTCYWNIRGLGQPIRLALEYACADFIDVRIEAGDPGRDSYKAHWQAQKLACGLPFGGNLPFFIDGDTGVRLVQSNSILRYIGRKFDLMGDGSPEQTCQLDMLLDQLVDYDNGFTGMAYRTFNDGGKATYIADTLPSVLKWLGDALGAKPYLVCGTPTVVDFKAFELMLKYEKAFGDGALAAVPNMVAFVDRMKALPTVAAYLASDRCITHPINNHHAQFK